MDLLKLAEELGNVSQACKLFGYSRGTLIDTECKIVHAYRHAKRLGVNTCPYCNASFTFTIRTNRMKSRPQFDLFLKKSGIPILVFLFMISYPVVLIAIRVN